MMISFAKKILQLPFSTSIISFQVHWLEYGRLKSPDYKKLERHIHFEMKIKLHYTLTPLKSHSNVNDLWGKIYWNTKKVPDTYIWL